MSEDSLYDKVFGLHTVGEVDGKPQIVIGKHFLHEVTSPPAFDTIREKGLKVRNPERTFAILDHVIPTKVEERKRPYKDEKAEAMTSALEKNVEEFGIKYFAPGKGQGVCHVVYPEQGLVWPGSTIVCGDSHTSTYGALGALAFGIGTTQVSQVLATQTVAMDKLKVKKILFEGRKPTLDEGVTAKDMALRMISDLGAKGGAGYAYELAGDAVENLSIEQRMTLCNMGVEGGAKACYINPDEKVIEYLKGRLHSPKDLDKLRDYMNSIRSSKDAQYDDSSINNLEFLRPMVTWGTSPDQAWDVNGTLPLAHTKEDEEAYKYMGLKPGDHIEDISIDVAFIGSCTNGRLSDLEMAAEIFEKTKEKVKVQTLIVPGSEEVQFYAEQKGLDKIFKEAGAEWREPGCSMCLAMNPDKLEPGQRSISTSNRNFEGRQGPGGRTHLANPYTVAASAIEGKITDPTQYLRGAK